MRTYRKSVRFDAVRKAKHALRDVLGAGLAAKKARASMNRFLGFYTHAGLLADREGLCLFSAVPKLHWAWHWMSRSRWIHPRRVACWLDEDFMKHCKILAGYATRGTAKHKVPCYFMLRYSKALALAQEFVAE